MQNLDKIHQPLLTNPFPPIFKTGGSMMLFFVN